jgi:hypothetical protein
MYLIGQLRRQFGMWVKDSHLEVKREEASMDVDDNISANQSVSLSPTFDHDSLRDASVVCLHFGNFSLAPTLSFV